MASLKKSFVDVVAQVLFRKATVARAESLSSRYRRFTLADESLKSAGCAPGDKIQVVMGTGDLRTYSPYAFDAARGTFELLVYVQGEAPGAAWARRVAEGETVRFFGPRRSLGLPVMAGPFVLFGDETSLGVARSLVDLRSSTRDVALVFECNTVEETAAAAQAIGLGAPTLVGPGDDHARRVEDAVRAAIAARPEAQLVLTGSAQSIQALRARLKADPPAGLRAQKTRAYWSLGKRGLD